MNNQFDGEKVSGNTMPAFSSAFDDDSSRPAMTTDGQPEVKYSYIPPMYGQPLPQGMQEWQAANGQQSPQAQYLPPVYMQPGQQYTPPMYGQLPPQLQQGGQSVQYAPPIYLQQAAAYPALPKKVMDRKLFRKHCTKIGLMLMADTALMFGVIFAVIFAAIFVLVLTGRIDTSSLTSQEVLQTVILVPVMIGGGLSAVVGNMTPAALHLRKWRFRFTDPFRGDKLSPVLTLTVLFTALGLNSAWGYAYYYLKDLFGEFMDYVPESADTLYTPATMPLIGMVFYLIWVCLIAPVTEEYIFRGAMLKTLSNYGSGFAIVASAFAFGLMHGNMEQTPMAFLVGLMLGYIAAKSGNIRQSVFIHFANNTIASLYQILLYFKPEWCVYYEKYIGYFDKGTMIFAALALLYFVFRRTAGLNSRKRRLASGSVAIKRAERAWCRLEIPDERRLPRLDSVRHKFFHFVTSGGMMLFIIFYLLCLFYISFVPYITKSPIPGMFS